MNIYQLSLAIDDKADNPKASKKEGDIISVISYEASWGRSVLDEYLCIVVQTSVELNKLKSLASQIVFYDNFAGVRLTSDDMHLALSFEDKSNPIENRFSTLFKRRYCVPIDLDTVQKIITHTNIPREKLGNINGDTNKNLKFIVDSLDMSKVRNNNIMYQPFLKKSKVLSQFNNSSHMTYDKNEKFYRCSDGKLISNTDFNHPRQALFLSKKYGITLSDTEKMIIDDCIEKRRNYNNFDEVDYWTRRVNVGKILNRATKTDMILTEDKTLSELVDCGGAIDEKKEIVIDLDINKIIWDKYLNMFVSPTEV